MINTMIFPIIKKYWKLLVSILIVSALGCAMLIGLSSSHKSLSNTLNKYINDYNYLDAEIVTDIQDEKILENSKYTPCI